LGHVIAPTPRNIKRIASNARLDRAAMFYQTDMRLDAAIARGGLLWADASGKTLWVDEFAAWNKPVSLHGLEKASAARIHRTAEGNSPTSNSNTARPMSQKADDPC
jgi:hypothetical protein